MNREMMENKKPMRRNKKNENKYRKLVNKCAKHKKMTKKRKCNLDEYIKFSGASVDNQGV